MPHALKFEADGTIVRRDFADHAPGNIQRVRLRELNNDQRRKDGNDPFNEGFNFTADEWELLKKIRPALFDPDPVARHKAWKAFAETSEGKMFRIK